jgi:thiopeptide-type bacteriocin biosynthesis protein
LNNISSHSSIVLRTPLLAYNTITELIENEQTLKEAYQNPVLQEALYIASPDLHEQLQEWVNGKQFEIKTQQKFINALIRYLLRMAFRPTPFGLFAGVASIVQDSKSETGIFLEEVEHYKKHLRLDMQVVGSVIEKVAQNKTIRNYLKFYPNSSLYRLGNQHRYLEYHYENKFRKYHVSGIAFNEFITLILQYTQAGISIGELVNALAHNDADIEQTEHYIHELIDAQILVSELELTVTGEDAAVRLLTQLQNIPSASRYTILLNEILTQIQGINESNIGFPVSEYQKIEALLKDAEIPFEVSKLFQMVLQKPLKSGNIPAHYSKNILKTIGLLKVFNSKRSKTIIDSFCEAYYERYEDREMSLLEVLDPETGIGFPVEQGAGSVAPFVDDILIAGKQSNQTLEWNHVDNLLIDLMQDALKNNLYTIELDEKKLNQFDEPATKLPASFSAMASIVYLNDKEYIYLHSAGGSSANQLLGRFCHADNNIEKLCKDIAAHEQRVYEDAIRAEIVHIPESRLGNILQRPVLSDYEIPYLAQSVLPTEFQIAVSDLMVSVRNNQIILRSKKMNKRVFPVLSSAHNFSANSLPVYHFLCSLQLQNTNTSFGFQWGALANKFNFFPRVVLKNMILSPAIWQLKKEDYSLIANANSDEILIEKTNSWSTENKMPRFIAIADGDNELTIDLENILCLRLFQEELKKRASIILVESFVNLEKSFVKSENGLFEHQLVFSFLNQEKRTVEFNSVQTSYFRKKVKRTFIPGDEWVYYKFYCGTNVADNILTNVIYPLTKQLLKQNIISQWFFIRYSDPKHHIRLRMKLNTEMSINDISSKVKFHINAYVASGMISKIQLDTYNRELERYRPETIEQAEELFFYDSELILELLKANINTGDLWKIAIYNVHRLFDDFQFSIDDRIKLSSVMKENFYIEHGLTKNNKHAREKINDKYRNIQKDMYHILTEKDDLVNQFVGLFEQQSEDKKTIIQDIIKIHEPSAVQDFLTSIIHMSLNRLFSSKQRIQEMLVYDYLNRGYLSIKKQNIV